MRGGPAGIMPGGWARQDRWEAVWGSESLEKLLEALVGEEQSMGDSGSCRAAPGAWLPKVPTALSLQAGLTSCPAHRLPLRRPPPPPSPQPCLPRPSPSQSGPPLRPRSSRGTGEQKGACL